MRKNDLNNSIEWNISKIESMTFDELFDLWTFMQNHVYWRKKYKTYRKILMRSKLIAVHPVHEPVDGTAGIEVKSYV